MSFGLALKAFFKILGNKDYATQVENISTAALPEPDKTDDQAEPAEEVIEEKAVHRSDAITLLSTLQREARLLDFLMEDISGYEDEQVGTAVRDIHGKSAKVLKQLFDIQPVTPNEEGDDFTVPSEFDPSEFTLSGSIQGDGPYTGTIEHSGWKAQQSELPEWNGNADNALIIAPAEIEVK